MYIINQYFVPSFYSMTQMLQRHKCSNYTQHLNAYYCDPVTNGAQRLCACWSLMCVWCVIWWVMWCDAGMDVVYDLFSSVQLVWQHVCHTYCVMIQQTSVAVLTSKLCLSWSWYQEIFLSARGVYYFNCMHVKLWKRVCGELLCELTLIELCCVVMNGLHLHFAEWTEWYFVGMTELCCCFELCEIVTCRHFT